VSPQKAQIAKSVIKRRRGNSNWGKAGLRADLQTAPTLTRFELLARGIPEEAWAQSPKLRQFARKFHNTRYVPEYLLEFWGIYVLDDFSGLSAGSRQFSGGQSK